MIRRDYILRMVEEFIQALARIKMLQQGRRPEEAAGAIDEEFKRLVGQGAHVVAQLSETDLLAKLIQGEPTQVVRDKTLILSALLKEAGDLAAEQDRPKESRACHLKGLHLLLSVLAQGEDFEYPDFVPKVEVFVVSLQDSPLPIPTQALLMQHYERTGQFARAEDALFAMLDLQPDSSPIVEFGIAFYERLQRRGDAALEAGNLPRAEIESGLAQLRAGKMPPS